jgi:hypothetical protein
MKVSFVSHNEIGKKVIVIVGDLQKSLSETETRMCMYLQYGDLSWPPLSPDLAAPDFFLWGYLKERGYQTKPRN